MSENPSNKWETGRSRQAMSHNGGYGYGFWSLQTVRPRVSFVGLSKFAGANAENN